MVIVNKPIKDLIPYEKNPRRNDEAVKYVANSIKAFGFKVPIVIDNKNVIVAGHTRLMAAKQLGLKEVPCIIADDLSEEQVKAYRLADNMTASKSTWDADLLNTELFELSDIDMVQFGFEAVDADSFGDSFGLDDGDKKPFQQITLTVHDEQAKLILAAIQYAQDNDLVKETFGNENKNGNGLYEVVREWAEQKTLF